MKSDSPALFPLPRALTVEEAFRPGRRQPGRGQMAAPLALGGVEDVEAMDRMPPYGLGCFVLSLYRLSWRNDLAGAFLGTDGRALRAVENAAQVAGLGGVPLPLLLRLCIPAAVFFPFDRQRARLAAAVAEMPPWRSGFPPAVETFLAALQAHLDPASVPGAPVPPKARKPRKRKGGRAPALSPAKREASRLARAWSRLFQFASGIVPLPTKRSRRKPCL